MPVQRHHCFKCGDSVYNKIINGVRVPFVMYFIVAQPPDTGKRINPNRTGANAIPLPHFARELLNMSEFGGGEPRVEICMQCVSDIFGLPLVTADQDPMFDGDMDNIPDVRQIKNDGEMDSVARERIRLWRVFFAIALGRGTVTIDQLPLRFRPPPLFVPPAPTPTEPLTGALGDALAGLPEDSRRAILERYGIDPSSVPSGGGEFEGEPPRVLAAPRTTPAPVAPPPEFLELPPTPQEVRDAQEDLGGSE